MKNHCPQLTKDEWHLGKHIWDKRPFYQEHYGCILNLPINLQTKVRQAITKLQARDLLEETPLIFSTRENSWGGDLLISIKKHVPDLETRSISGHFISFLFNGNYKQVPYWVRKVQEYGRREYLDFSELYIWHVTCPRCIQKYGQAQTVIFAKML